MDAQNPSHPMASFDREMEAYMEARGIPGGSLAVVRDGRLVYTRGYGWTDRDTKEPVRPEALFRIASISKPITAVAVMKLVQEGKLRLDEPAFERLRLQPILETGAKPDPRLERVTVRDLLRNSGGWDREQSFDPMFRPRQIAAAAGMPAPAGPDAVIRYMMGKPLDFDPGTRYAYSNFGYCILGRIIERVSGMSYERYVQQEILAPMGIRRMRIGRSLPEGRAEGEVRYFMPRGETGESVFPGLPERVPNPYGSFHLEAMDSHGGWIASAVDLARFAAALDRPGACPILKPEFAKAMYERPPAPLWRNEDGAPADAYYGFGWMVRPKPGQGPDRANYWHGGALPGTWTLLVRRWDGLTWAALFNQRGGNPDKPEGEIDPALHRAADAVREWPKEDLFPRYR